MAIPLPVVKCDQPESTYQTLVRGALMADKRTGDWQFVDPDAFLANAPGDDEKSPTENLHGREHFLIVVDLLRTPESFFQTMATISAEPWFKPDRFFACCSRVWDVNRQYIESKQ